jgi:HD-GYP domain-containing protein (c-di-GMP phosphodiesterase class II)
VTLIERDADVSIYTFVRQENIQFFNYGFTHSVHTAIAGVLMARRLGWPSDQILVLTQAALIMNVAIATLQGRIATQDTPLRESQKTAIRAHPGQSVALLAQAGVTDAAWLTAVAQHHEHPDGSGYPDGRTEIETLALVLHFADTLTAKISPRASRLGVSIQQAARELFQEDHGGAMASALIKELGIYPPGDFVQLKSGELAVVMRRAANAKTPIAAGVTDQAGLPVARTMRRDTADPEFAIVASVTDRKRLAMLTRIPPQRLYGLSA